MYATEEEGGNPQTENEGSICRIGSLSGQKVGCVATLIIQRTGVTDCRKLTLPSESNDSRHNNDDKIEADAKAMRAESHQSRLQIKDTYDAKNCLCNDQEKGD